MCAPTVMHFRTPLDVETPSHDTATAHAPSTYDKTSSMNTNVQLNAFNHDTLFFNKNLTLEDGELICKPFKTHNVHIKAHHPNTFVHMEIRGQYANFDDDDPSHINDQKLISPEMNSPHIHATTSNLLDILSVKSKNKSQYYYSMLQTRSSRSNIAKEGYNKSYDVNQHDKHYFYFRVSNHRKKGELSHLLDAIMRCTLIHFEEMGSISFSANLTICGLYANILLIYLYINICVNTHLT
jgi:hypothetical protein